jgi:hypothetical protein
MGLDASVMCNCYKQGKTTPCPYPEFFHIDEEGFPGLNLPYDENEEKSDIFDTWLATCCEHPHMDYAAVYVSNWKGYQSFLQALEQVGWEHFPVLRAELPDGNHGLTSADSARMALKELETFKTLGQSVVKTFLVNTETQETLGTSSITHSNMLGWNGRTGMNIGFDEKGFFILDSWEMNRELFRAKRFEQRMLEAEGLDRPQQFEYIDLDSGRRFVCSTPVRIFVEDGFGQLKQEYPQQMHIEQRTVGAEYYTYLLDPLITIFKASVETGNPVRWS